ncbi:MAG: biliverdin-producing heme oxygenase [Kofleriaceae bacterium]
MVPILRRLRHETLEAHREAERHVRILDHDATEQTYARYLSRMFGFHAPLEDLFACRDDLIEIGFDPLARRKQDLIRVDLARLGRAQSPVSLCLTLPDVSGLPRALGVAYVLEGSTLGGPFILSRMRPRFEHLFGSATTFLEGYGAATGVMWRRFGGLLEHHVIDERACTIAIAAARETFATLTEWLDEPAADPPHPFRSRFSPGVQDAPQ